MFGLTPKNTKIDLATLTEADLEYYCTTQHIDKEVMKGRGLTWDQAVADSMEKEVRYYFVVKTNREYDVIAGPAFEEWMKDIFPLRWIDSEHQVRNDPHRIATAKGITCKNHYVSFLLQEYPDKKPNKKQSFTSKKRK
jgi:hypothetical protein